MCIRQCRARIGMLCCLILVFSLSAVILSKDVTNKASCSRVGGWEGKGLPPKANREKEKSQRHRISPLPHWTHTPRIRKRTRAQGGAGTAPPRACRAAARAPRRRLRRRLTRRVSPSGRRPSRRTTAARSCSSTRRCAWAGLKLMQCAELATLGTAVLAAKGTETLQVASRRERHAMCNSHNVPMAYVM